MSTSSAEASPANRTASPGRGKARETLAMKRLLEEIIATHTKQDLEKVGKDMERDYFMTAQEALDYGIIDTVIAHRGTPAMAAAS